MIDIIFFKSIGIFAKVWSPVSETLHTYKHVYDLHCWQVTVDWYGNKLVARNFLRTCWGRGGEGGGGEKRGIDGPPSNVWRNILCVLWDHRVFTRRDARARHRRGKSHRDFRIVGCLHFYLYISSSG